MKIYTKTGDDGTTGLFAGGRVPKDHPRIAAYGSVDELNALLGIVLLHARAAANRTRADEPSASITPQALEIVSLLVSMLEQVQHDLFAIGAELATPEPARHGTQLLTGGDGIRLEGWIDQLENYLTPLANFILPGGSMLAGWLHWARTVCRRSERDVVHLTHQVEVQDCTSVIVYLNRLSDLLFVMARATNHALGVADIAWQKPVR